jgi:hypothetical protein
MAGKAGFLLQNDRALVANKGSEGSLSVIYQLKRNLSLAAK